jgi:hypothetical protein
MLDINLDTFSWPAHLFIRFWYILGILGLPCHDPASSKDAVKPCDSASIAPLTKLDPEYNEAGMNIALSHITD